HISRRAPALVTFGRRLTSPDPDAPAIRQSQLMFGLTLTARGRRSGPLPRGPHFVGCNLAAEPPVDTLVEQHPHETVSISRSFASSRKAITCSRVPDGNPSRKSSMVSPASM